MAEFTPRNPEFAERVRSSFARQGFMAYLGADLGAVEPGACQIRLPYRDELSQQHHYFHGGVIGTLADNAGGYAAFTLMGENDSVLTVEFKLNIVAPGEGEFLVARGHVVKAGRTLTVCRSDVFGVAGGVETLCGTAQMTLMRLADRPDRPAD
jgi:uncharacterized protein (TIGR00369 family)